MNAFAPVVASAVAGAPSLLRDRARAHALDPTTTKYKSKGTQLETKKGNIMEYGDELSKMTKKEIITQLLRLDVKYCSKAPKAVLVEHLMNAYLHGPVADTIYMMTRKEMKEELL